MIKNISLAQTLKLLALIFTLFFLISGYVSLTSTRITPVEESAAAGNTPSATVVVPTATQTATVTLQPTQTPAPSNTPHPTNTPTPSATVVAPTATQTPIATETPLPAPTETPTTEQEPATSTATPTATETPSGPPTETPTPTITPTPVPRTVPAGEQPDYTAYVPHLWFTRPYTDAYFTWGSAYYPYGTNNDGQYLWHRGTDIQNPEGVPVVAVGDGRVVFAGSDLSTAVGPDTDFYGNAVIVQHQDWRSQLEADEGNAEPAVAVFTLYGHVSKILVKAGQSVQAGQPIALTGQEGVALGPHLHLEVRLGENSYLNTQNPDLWVRPDKNYGVIAGRVVDVNGFFVPQQLITLHRAAEPGKFWRQTRTYPDHRYTPDSELGETFVFADVPVGDYLVKTTFDGRNYTLPITVSDQNVSFVLIEGDAPPPPTATPAPVQPAAQVEGAADETPPPSEDSPEQTPTPDS